MQVSLSGVLLLDIAYNLVSQFCCYRPLTHIRWMSMPFLDLLIHHSPGYRFSNFLGPHYAGLKQDNAEIRFSIHIPLNPTDHHRHFIQFASDELIPLLIVIALQNNIWELTLFYTSSHFAKLSLFLLKLGKNTFKDSPIKLL